MKIQKLNKMIPRYMSLLLLFMISILALAMGTTYARYLAQRQERLAFEVTEPQTILLGVINEDVFVPTDRLEWVVEEETATLSFAVANGSAAEGISSRDQAIQLRMLGSLGIGEEGKTPSLTATFQTPDGKKQSIKGKAASIKSGTAMYHSYGAGWLYSFYESTAGGTREANFELPGGDLNYIIITVKVKGNLPENVNLLQPLISAEAID